MTYVTVDVDLAEFDTDDLIEEVRIRGYVVLSGDDHPNEDILIRTIFEKRRLGQDYQSDLDQLIYRQIGRIL